ncbi:hypothetical protein EV426DRAFT_664099 [Tirmania nivea]|nr:hypothetical protein EV426DRAFT_664099 [Tirmania nivea]
MSQALISRARSKWKQVKFARNGAMTAKYDHCVRSHARAKEKVGGKEEAVEGGEVAFEEGSKKGSTQGVGMGRRMVGVERVDIWKGVRLGEEVEGGGVEGVELEAVVPVAGEEVEVEMAGLEAVVDAGAGGELGLKIIGQESNIEQLSFSIPGKTENDSGEIVWRVGSIDIEDGGRLNSESQGEDVGNVDLGKGKVDGGRDD